MRAALPMLLVILFQALACSEPPPDAIPPNVGPRARFSSPVWVAADTEARFDASESFDPDGTVVAYRFLFGDGSPEVVSASPSLAHVYLSPGSFTVWLTVVDGDGIEGRAAHGLGATLDAPSPCLGPADCESTERCGADALCYRDGPGDACAGDLECAALGLSCHGGVCIEPECASDEDCFSTELCRSGRCFPLPGDGGAGDAG